MEGMERGRKWTIGLIYLILLRIDIFKESEVQESSKISRVALSLAFRPAEEKCSRYNSRLSASEITPPVSSSDI